MNSTYKDRKEKARETAREWQREFQEEVYSWGELFACQEYFEKLGRRYGLLREFRENEII